MDPVITREQLYELVWSQTRSSVAKKFGIADNEVVKLCKKLQVPIPPAGYWQRVKFGKNIPARPPLSNHFSGESFLAIAVHDKGIASALDILQQEIESDQRLKLIVPNKLTAPDHLILKAKVSLADALKGPWYRDGERVCTSSNHLRIGVSKQNIDRALRIMDVLIKALKTRGHTFQIDANCSYLVILGQKIEISMFEIAKRVEVQDKYGTRRDLKLTGKLALCIKRRYENRQWVDGKTPLEGQVPKLIAALEIEGQKLKAYQEELERGWERQRIEAEKRRQIEEIKAKEIRDFKRLIAEANQWRQAEMIRSYINQLEKNGYKKGIEPTEFVGWIEWARKKVDWLDPDIERYDEALNDVDRTKFF